MLAFDFNNAYPHNAAMNVPALIAEIKRASGLTQAELAERWGVDQSTVSKWSTGKHEPEENQKRQIIGSAIEYNLVPRGAKVEDFSVPIVGYVERGGSVVYSDDTEHPDKAQMPPQNSSSSTVALKVRGETMTVHLEEGWTIYHEAEESPPSEGLTGKLCVVGMADGTKMIRKLIPGRLKGKYDLYSANAAPLLDQPVEWAARVSWIAPS